MSKKKVFQYSLLFFIFLVSFLFYKNYFSSNERIKSDYNENLDIKKNLIQSKTIRKEFN